MSLREIREQLLKEGKQAKCKFCHRQLKTKLWMEILIAQEKVTWPKAADRRKKQLESQGYILSSGFCNDCDKFVEKLDKELGSFGA